ncbi:MAG: hypothetical protein IPF99_34195 [Deltaproteobacteria bacterium]|nr:hypothetical protein [Deltaproteobacteria bacterium]
MLGRQPLWSTRRWHHDESIEPDGGAWADRESSNSPRAATHLRAAGDGSVQCWGDNSFGQLGDGTMTNRWNPTAVPGLAGVVQLAVGFGYTCARLGDGSVRCLGANAAGQLGDGPRTSRSNPTLVPGLTGVVELAAGLIHTCARLADGSVRMLGLQ